MRDGLAASLLGQQVADCDQGFGEDGARAVVLDPELEPESALVPAVHARGWTTELLDGAQALAERALRLAEPLERAQERILGRGRATKAEGRPKPKPQRKR